MKDNKEIKKELHRYLDDLYTREEASQVLQHIDDEAYREAWEELSEEVWEESASRPQPTEAERELYKEEARLLLRRIAPEKSYKWRYAAMLVAGIAAVVIIVIGSIGYVNHISERQQVFAEAVTSFGERKRIALPDGTVLTLNSCSSVRYPRKFSNNIRKVELKGEGYFQVARNEDAPFIVTTSQFDVKVLGTQFNVKAYPTDEIISVCVESGKVQVDLPEAMMRLTSREQIQINTISGDFSKKKEQKDVAAWRKGSLRFSSTPIRDVAKELERVYNCRITFAPGQAFDNLITGEHDNNSLDAVLQSIAFISGDIKYKKENANVFLYKE